MAAQPVPPVPAMFRPGMLAGMRVAVAGAGAAVREACSALGAEVAGLDADLLDEEAVTGAAEALARPAGLVVAADEGYLAAGGGLAGLRAALDGAWNATRAVANAHWIPAEGESAPGGRLVLLAPAADGGAPAGAAAAGLENTARTLGTEWARHAITTVAICPRAGAGTEAV